MSEFIAGITFDMWYWYEDDAWCLSVNNFVNPVTYDIKSATKFEQCSKTIVDCLDKWD